jgi:SOS-response transcriptional repressor LexA
MGIVQRRVFLSHTSELEKFPQGQSFAGAAREAVSRAGQSAIDMAYFTAQQDSSADYCRRRVQTADVYVGILGFMYGSLVRDDERKRSYVELEFDAAAEKGMPQLIFLLDDEATILLPRKYLNDPDHEKQQTAFRARVRAVTVAKVDSPERLMTLLLQALLELPGNSDAEAPPGQADRSGQVIDLYPLADMAQQRLQAAVALLESTERIMDLVERRAVVPAGIDDLPYADRAAIHELRAAAVRDPAEEVMSYSRQAAGKVAAAGDYVGQLSARRFAAYSDDLAQTVQDVSRLERISGELLARVARSQRDLSGRSVKCQDYRIPHASLSSALADLQEVSRQAASMRNGLRRLHAAPESETASATGQPSQDGITPVEPWADFTEADVVPTVGEAAAGSGATSDDQDGEPAWVPADYSDGTGTVAVRVRGDSMIGDDLRTGDYVILARGPGVNVVDGDMAVVRKGGTGDRETFVKRLYYEGDGLRLESSKPGQEAIRIREDENPAIEGKVIGIFRPIN